MAIARIVVTIEYGGDASQERPELNFDDWIMAGVAFELLCNLADESQSIVRVQVFDIRGVLRYDWCR